MKEKSNKKKTKKRKKRRRKKKKMMMAQRATGKRADFFSALLRVWEECYTADRKM